MSQILLLSQPRSGCHLLQRMLFEKQSNVKLLEHPYSSSRGLQLEWLQDPNFENGMQEPGLSHFIEEIEKGNKSWQDALEACRSSSRVPVVHLHPLFPIHPDGVLDILKIITSSPGAAQIGSLGHENFTMIPPSLILPTTIPILTIRNPHLVVPSAVRAMAKMGIPQGGGRANLLVTTSNIWNVAFYEYFTARGIKPMVVDADDYMTDPNFVERVCKRVGLEVGELQMEWEANRGGEGLHEMYYASQKTLVESERMLPQRAGKSVDIEKEREGWKEEFGDDLGLIEEAVDLTMGLYKWLHERRFR